MIVDATLRGIEADRIYDISRPIAAATPPWPGDTPFALHWSWRQDAGDSVNVSSVAMSVHTATHIDAPYHFDREGVTTGEMDLAPFWGPSVVVDLSASIDIDVPIGWEAFAEIDFERTPRILIKTLYWTEPTAFPAAIPTLAVETVAGLAERGVLLIGVDLPSVDAIDSAHLPIHHALGDAGIRILESLDLSAVAAGEYELSALPLRLIGADGAPTRAALRRI